jgi:hypothetical protein
LTPVFWGLVGIAEDTYWLGFSPLAAVTQYLLPNTLFNVISVTLSVILIRDTLPNHHIPLFAFLGILTDILSRHLLHHPFFSLTTLSLYVLAISLLLPLSRLYKPLKRPLPISKLVVFGVSVAFALHAVIFLLYFLSSSHTPIPHFIDTATHTFHTYATTSSHATLSDAVTHYHTHYGRPPPPGFDIWFQFARDRGVKVLGEYDQIVEDLRPFWGIEPRVLRERVARVGGNAANNVGVVSIRGNKPEIKLAPQWLVSSRYPLTKCVFTRAFAFTLVEISCADIC